MAILSIALTVVLSYSTSLKDSLLSDDFVLINKSSATPAALLSSLLESHSDGNLRPVGIFVFGTYKLWANLDPFAWHIFGVVLNALDTIAVYLLAFCLSRRQDFAFVTGSLFAVQAAHPEATAWVASTFELLATLFSTLAILVVTWQFRLKERVHSASTYILICLLTALAILSKESAYAIPAVGLLIVIGWRRYSLRNWTSLAVAAITASVLFAHRWIVYGGPGGYLDVATGRPTILGTTWLSGTKALLYRPWGILFFPLNLSAGLSPGLLVLLGVYLVAISYLVSRFNPRCRTVIFTLACVPVALIPPLHLALIGYDLAGTRVFFLASVFFCICSATLITSLPSRRAQYVVGAVILVFQFAALQQNLLIRHRVSLLARNVCEQVRAELTRTPALAISGVPSVLDGVFFLGNGLAECADARIGMVEADRPHRTLKWEQTSRRLKSLEDGDLRQSIWLESK